MGRLIRYLDLMELLWLDNLLQSLNKKKKESSQNEN